MCDFGTENGAPGIGAIFTGITFGTFPLVRFFPPRDARLRNLAKDEKWGKIYFNMLLTTVKVS